MKNKHKFQVALDAIALFTLISLLGYPLWSPDWHEWLGLLFGGLILLHNGLHGHWYRRLRQGPYSGMRLFTLCLNGLAALGVLLALGSGLLLSRFVWPEFPWHQGSDLVRKIHMTSVHWLQIILALHIGLYWPRLAGFFRTLLVFTRGPLYRQILAWIWRLVALYGGYAFISHQQIDYLLLQVEYSLFDPDTQAWQFYLRYVAVMLGIAYFTQWLLPLISNLVNNNFGISTPNARRR
jgi:hypothetical protein